MIIQKANIEDGYRETITEKPIQRNQYRRTSTESQYRKLQYAKVRIPGTDFCAGVEEKRR